MQTHLFHHMSAISSSVRAGMRRLGTACLVVKMVSVIETLGGFAAGGGVVACSTKGNDS